jgi:putative acetyltransferase
VIEIAVDDPARADVVGLLTDHLADMHATSPPESVHALDVEALRVPSVTFWTARREGHLLGCAALKELDATHAEVKSMRTAAESRGSGVATALLRHVLDEARRRGYARVSLETGSQDFFAPARRLYTRHGFTECGPFADYALDPHSRFFTRQL